MWGDEMSDDVEILPTIGEALSIKTIKQGRKGSQKRQVMAQDFVKSSTGIIKGRAQINKNHLLTAHTIIKHEKSTDKEKQFAKEFLNTEKPNQRQFSILWGIARRLMRVK